MDFKQQVFSVISQFTGQNNVITVNVALVEFVGDLETGLFLSQMIYWSDRGKRSDGFFYKTDEEWQQEIMLSKYSVRKARKKLEEMELLETVVKKANGNPTVHYKFNQDRFSELFISFLRNRKNEIANTKERSFENDISLTEITTETTTETNNNIYAKPVQPKSKKEKYAEFVSMTETEYQKLISQYGEDKTKEMIKVLDNYKGANGKKYKSDYRAILNWVADKVLNKKGGFNSGKAQVTRNYADEYDDPFK